MRARHTHPDALSALAKLTALNLPFMRENYQPLAHTAADKHWSHLDYFTELLNGEAAAREDRRVQRCIRQARFPVLKTIWPASTILAAVLPHEGMLPVGLLSFCVLLPYVDSWNWGGHARALAGRSADRVRPRADPVGGGSAGGGDYHRGDERDGQERLVPRARGVHGRARAVGCQRHGRAWRPGPGCPSSTPKLRKYLISFISKIKRSTTNLASNIFCAWLGQLQ